MVGVVDKRSSPTSVTRVRFLYSPSHEFVVGSHFVFSQGFSPGFVGIVSTETGAASVGN